MTRRATNLYSDAGGLQPPRSVFSQRGRDRPLGQLSLAYTGSSAGQKGGLCKPGYDSVCVCVCVVAFLVPADPAQCGGAAGVEMLWKLVAVISTSCLLCAGDVEGLFSSSSSSSHFLGMDGHLAATFIN